MRVIEIMGIEQARKWGACSLNDFRRVCCIALLIILGADCTHGTLVPTVETYVAYPLRTCCRSIFDSFCIAYADFEEWSVRDSVFSSASSV